MSFFSPQSVRIPLRLARLTLLVLSASVVLQSFAYLSQSLLGETAIFEFFWLVLDLPETVAVALARGGALLVLVASLVLTVRRWKPLGYAVGAWFAFSSIAEMTLGGARFLDIAPAADAVRYLVPVALVWAPAPAAIASGPWPRPNVRELAWRRLLEVAVAATFLAHGWEALQHHPQFLDYLLLTARRLLEWPLAETHAGVILTVIGAIDVVLGLIVLAGGRSRVLLGYMAVWGLITALARTVYGGIWAYPSTLVRAANVGGPLALFLLASLPESDHEETTDDADLRS